MTRLPCLVLVVVPLGWILACGGEPPDPATSASPVGPRYTTFQSPDWVGHLPGADGLVGTDDDLFDPAENPEGVATFTRRIGTPVGTVTTFLDGVSWLPEPLSRGPLGAIENSFELVLRGRTSSAFSGEFFSLGTPAPVGTVQPDGALTTSYVLGACFDGSPCEPTGAVLDAEFDVSTWGFSLVRGLDPAGLPGITPELVEYFEMLQANAPPDWTALQLAFVDPYLLTSANTRGAEAAEFIGGTASGVSVSVTRDPLKVGLGYVASAASPAPGAILDELAAEVHFSGLAFAGPFAPVATESLGELRMAARGSGDLRTEPGTAALDLFGGQLAATAHRANRVRRVDGATGRLLRGDADEDATCNTGAEPDCYQPGDLLAQSRGLYDAICAMSRGFTVIDGTACTLDIFQSQVRPLGFPTTPTVANFFSLMLTGDSLGTNVASAFLGPFSGAPPIPPADLPFVDLGLTDRTGDGIPDDPPAPSTLDQHLSSAQQALLGCGPFQNPPTSCQEQGLNLLWSEIGALTSAWALQPGFTGTTSLDSGQPGTLPFVAANGRVGCQRDFAVIDEVVLPGCLGPGEVPAGGSPYDVARDGDPAAIGVREDLFGPNTLGFDCPLPGDTGFCDTGHPFTGEPWATVMDALSWNLQMLFVALSGIGSSDLIAPSAFNPADPLRLDGCSFAAPSLCSNVLGLWSLTVGLAADDPQGLPRRRWVWEAGAEYDVTSATDNLGRYEGGVLHASGPGEGSLLIPLLLLEDRDGDGVTDESDNCWGIANPGQEDANGDRIGDVCLCDFSADGLCSIDDFTLFLTDFVAGSDSGNGTDMNGDGRVDIDDFTLFLPGFVVGRPGGARP